MVQLLKTKSVLDLTWTCRGTKPVDEMNVWINTMLAMLSVNTSVKTATKHACDSMVIAWRLWRPLSTNKQNV